MRKRIVALLMLAALVLAVAGCSSDPAYIGEEQAKQIALESSYFTEEDVTNLAVSLVEEENGCYVVAFTAEGMDYVYELDAKTGEILVYPLGI